MSLKFQPYRFDCWSARCSLVSPYKHQFTTIEYQNRSNSILDLDPMSIVTRPLSLITHDGDGHGKNSTFTSHNSQLHQKLARTLGLFSQLHMLQMEPLVDELYRTDCIAIMRKLITNKIVRIIPRKRCCSIFFIRHDFLHIYTYVLTSTFLKPTNHYRKS